VSYKDPEKRRAYHREYDRKWLAARRNAWLAENGPCVDCGTWDDLQIDHVDASTKISSRVWSWSEKKRLAELAKCVVRCRVDHQEKTVRNHENARGEQIGASKLTADDIRAIRASTLRPYRLIAEQYEVDASLIGYIIRRELWKHIQ
jgi:hypothetical protein